MGYDKRVKLHKLPMSTSLPATFRSATGRTVIATPHFKPGATESTVKLLFYWGEKESLEVQAPSLVGSAKPVPPNMTHTIPWVPGQNNGVEVYPPYDEVGYAEDETEMLNLVNHFCSSEPLEVGQLVYQTVQQARRGCQVTEVNSKRYRIAYKMNGITYSGWRFGVKIGKLLFAPLEHEDVAEWEET